MTWVQFPDVSMRRYEEIEASGTERKMSVVNWFTVTDEEQIEKYLELGWSFSYAQNENRYYIGATG